MCVLVVLLHARFSVVRPIPFLLAAFFGGGHPYIESTTVLPDTQSARPRTKKVSIVMSVDYSKVLFKIYTYNLH